ncbi:hypothetical protein B566_EDAN007630 [Ephemera danica]|nr:hypothetical protein B566_EDAN007630 [Ephemera danica]
MDEEEDCVVEGSPLEQHLSSLGLGESLNVIPRTGYLTSTEPGIGISDTPGYGTQLMNFVKRQTSIFFDPVPNIYEWVSEKVVREVLGRSTLLRQVDLQWLLRMRRNLRGPSSIRSPDWDEFWSASPGSVFPLALGLYLGAAGLKQIVRRQLLYRHLSSRMGCFIKELEANFSAQRCTYALLHGHQTMQRHSVCSVHEDTQCPLWEVFSSTCGLLTQLKAALAVNIDAITMTLFDMLNELLKVKPQDFAVPASFTVHPPVVSLELVMEEAGVRGIKANLQILSEVQARILFLLSGYLLLGNSKVVVHQIGFILSKHSADLVLLRNSLTHRLDKAKTSSLDLQRMQSNVCKATTLPVLMPLYSTLSQATLHAQRLLTTMVQCQELALNTTDPLPGQMKCSMHMLRKELTSTIEFIEATEKKIQQLFPEQIVPNLNNDLATNADIAVERSAEGSAQAQVFEAVGEQQLTEPKEFYTNSYETPKLGSDVMKELKGKLNAASFAGPITLSSTPFALTDVESTSKARPCIFSDSSFSAINSSSSTYTTAESSEQAEELPSSERQLNIEVFNAAFIYEI